MPTITHKITPEREIKAAKVDIEINVETDDVQVIRIQKPDGEIENTNIATYTATENGDYKFIVSNSKMKDIEYVVSVDNIQSRIDLLGGKDGYNIEFDLDSQPSRSPLLEVENEKVHFKLVGDSSTPSRSNCMDSI